MVESTDLIAKRAAYTALEASIKLHIVRAEELAAEAQILNDEIEKIVSQEPGAEE